MSIIKQDFGEIGGETIELMVVSVNFKGGYVETPRKAKYITGLVTWHIDNSRSGFFIDVEQNLLYNNNSTTPTSNVFATVTDEGVTFTMSSGGNISGAAFILY